MLMQGLLQGPPLPCKFASPHSTLATRLHQASKAPSHASSALFSDASVCNRRSSARLRATSPSVEDIDERSPAAAPSPSDAAVDSSSLDSIELISEAGRDYGPLRDALKAQDFQKADDITRDELIQLAGTGAVKRGWVYFTEVKAIGEGDLKTIDALWSAASSKKFGFSSQRQIWMQQSKYWSRFFKKIDWTQGANNNYRKWPMEFTYTMEAPKGHLPLTNALRGTQLLEAILEHPAFDKGAGKENGGKPSWMT